MILLANGFSTYLLSINSGHQAFRINTSHSHPKPFKTQKAYSQEFSQTKTTMGFRLPGIRKALFTANQESLKAVDAPKD